MFKGARLRSGALATLLIPTLTSCTVLTGGMLRFPDSPEHVTFQNGVVSLSGILMEPEGKGPFPAVVFVHGSGPSTYDQPSWRAHANAFVRRGFAVLVYDKRGCGNSTGTLALADYDDLAGDVVAGVKFLRSLHRIRPDRIGLLGRSEGGWVAPLAATRLEAEPSDRSVAFVIMSSGAGVSPLDQTLYATAVDLCAHGASDRDVSSALAVRRRIWDYYRRAAADSTLARTGERDSLRAALRSFAHFKSKELPTGIPAYDAGVYGAAARSRYYEPLATLRALRAPLLAAFGATARSVDPASSIAVLEKLKSEGKDITVKVFPGTGHTLLTPWWKGPPRYVSGYLRLVTDWAARQVSR